MNIPKDGTSQLPKVGLDWIALKVNFQGRKGIKFFNFYTYCPFIQNLFGNLNIYLGMKLPQDGANELWRDGFDWIVLKVRKVRFGSFSHIYLCINQWYWNTSHMYESFSFSEILVLFSNFNGVYSF